MVMKNIKQLITLGFLSVFFFVFWSFTFASNNCLDFQNGELCLEISQDNNWYTVSSYVRNNNGLPAISCQVKTPERVGAIIYYLPWCAWKFRYDWTDWGNFTFYTNYDKYSKTIKYNLKDKKRDYLWWYKDDDWNDDKDRDEDRYNNKKADNFYVTVNDDTAKINQKLDITIKVRDRNNNTVYDYYEKIRFIIYKKIVIEITEKFLLHTII